VPRSKVYRPPFTVTSRVLSAAVAIGRLLGRIEALPSATPRVRLRRQNRVRTVQATLAIEGNVVDPDRVTALLDGKRVLGGRAEIREITNALRAYDAAPDFDSGRVADLLHAHRILMDGLASDAGRFRKKRVGVVQGNHVAHVAPPASQVPRLMGDLLQFVRADVDTLPLVKAAICHYEMEFIHPFSDGNGRIGRLWQHVILLAVHPVFEHVPVESVIRARQDAYYAALGASDRAGNATAFLEFAIDATHTALAELIAELRPERATKDTRLARARAHFSRGWFTRREYAALFPMLSAPTASRDLRSGLEALHLERHGDKATARYRFR
jgi:Fic family protein